jgi:hypothetical protein
MDNHIPVDSMMAGKLAVEDTPVGRTKIRKSMI